MTDKLTDKQKVLAVWPDAECLYSELHKTYWLFIDNIGDNPYCIGETEQKAWAYAARLIDKQNTKQ